MQSVASEPGYHDHPFTSLFAQFPFEQGDDTDVRADYIPWVKQFLNDLHELSHTDDGAEL